MKSKILSLILVIIVLTMVGYYFIQNDKEEVKPFEIKLSNYSNQVKEAIKNKVYAFETTLIDNDWIIANVETDIVCQEVYYSNENKVLLHNCNIPNITGNYYFYDKVYLEEDAEYKNIYENVKNQNIIIDKGNLLSDLATIDLNLKIETINPCVNNGKCEIGTELAIQVNDVDVYRFYVLSDDGEVVNLILDHNLNNYAIWAPSDNLEGPIDALEAVNKATLDWTNIPLRKYRVIDDNNDKVYKDIHIESRASIPSYTELIKENGQVASWLTTNINNGYWLRSASKSMSFYAWVVKSDGKIDTADISHEDYGVRPIIKLYK